MKEKRKPPIAYKSDKSNGMVFFRKFNDFSITHIPGNGNNTPGGTSAGRSNRQKVCFSAFRKKFVYYKKDGCGGGGKNKHGNCYMIKKIIYNILFISVLTIPVGLSHAQNWNFMPSPTRQNLARLDMLSENEGYAVSYDGLILKYDGSSWTIWDSLSTLLQNSRVKADSIWTMSDDPGDIYTIRVPDSDKAWLAVNNAERREYHLFSLDLEHKLLRLKNLPLKIRALDFLPSGQGFAVGDGGGYAFDGVGWKPLNLPVSLDFREVKWIDARKAAICGNRGAMLMGGVRDWKKIEHDIDVVLRDMDFISPDEGWFVGYNGIILHYKNGHIEQEIAETTENLWAVDMLASDYGFAVGTNGVILQYNGVFWDIFPFDPKVDLHDLEMLSPTEGFALGARGAILHFSGQTRHDAEGHNFLFADQVHLGSNYLMDRIDDVHGITAADFNNDHFIDLYLTCYRSLNHLLINNGHGYFRDMVIESGTGGNIESRVGKQKYEFGSLAADFDRDGDTDLFLAGKRKTSRYFLNNGKAVFTDETEQTGIPDNLEIIDGALADFNADGYPDLLFADEKQGVVVFQNMKYNRFRRNTIETAKLPTTGIRCVLAFDLDHDHDQDIVAVFQHRDPLVLINSGAGEFDLSIKNWFAGAVHGFVNSVSAGDINNDGFTDMYLCSEEGSDALFLYDKERGQYINKADEWRIVREGRSTNAVIADFNGDGYNDVFVARYGDDFLFINQQNQYFEERSAEQIYSKSGYLSGYNSGAVCADVDADGTPDLIVGNAEYWSSLLQNQSEKKALIHLQLSGTDNTREALGAKIWIWKSGTSHSDAHLQAFKEIIPSHGLFSQNQILTRFAVPDSQLFDVRIRFLNGEERWLYQISAQDGVIKISDASPAMRVLRFASRRILQILHIPKMVWELIKFIIFIIIIFSSVRFIEKRYEWRTSHTMFYVLLVIPLYIALTFFLRDSGKIYHFLPFAIIGFALGLLFAVNEPLRIREYLQRYRQEKVNQAGLQLSRAPHNENALRIVSDTLKIIRPYNQLVYYLYHPHGNYLLKTTSGGTDTLRAPERIKVPRDRILSVSDEIRLLTREECQWMLAGHPLASDNTEVFSLVRKRTFLGLVILRPDSDQRSGQTAYWEAVRYLFLQLAIALDNSRIMQNLSEQEKIAAIGTFAGGMIHNLKNPIDGLRMIIEMLCSEMPESDPKYEYVVELKNGVRNLKKQLLQSFEFITNRDLMHDEINVRGWLTGITDPLKRGAAPVRLLNTASEDLYIKGDREQLTYAIENIIKNALEASAFAKPVDINFKGNKVWLEICIKDEGSGISNEKLAHIFDMFYSTRGSGRGLGLTITHNIIRNHGGYIEVISEVNKGSAFTIVLPMLNSKGNYE